MDGETSQKRPTSPTGPISRRQALKVGAVAAGALATLQTAPAFASGRPSTSPTTSTPDNAGELHEGEYSTAGLPRAEIERILGTTDTHILNKGVLLAIIARKELSVRGFGIPFKPSWQENHKFFFQSLGGGWAMINGEMTVLPHEVQGVIDAFLAHGLVFQAFHQHFYGLDPQTFHVHMRGKGTGAQLAEALRAAVNQTSTAPLPQSAPATISTPLNVQRIETILGGEAIVGADGVVTVTVLRSQPTRLGGVIVNPALRVSSTVSIEPLSSTGSWAAVAPDFSMNSGEVQEVMRVMRKYGFLVNCLYNQETDEYPQHYFSHQLKIGDAYMLCEQVRLGLARTHVAYGDI